MDPRSARPSHVISLFYYALETSSAVQVVPREPSEGVQIYDATRRRGFGKSVAYTEKNGNLCWNHETIWVSWGRMWVFPEIGVPMGTPKPSIFMGFSIINQQLWGYPINGNLHVAQ